MRSLLLAVLLAPALALGADPAPDAAATDGVVQAQPMELSASGTPSAAPAIPTAMAPAAEAAPAADGPPRYGLLVDTGVPSGLGASFLFRPFPTLRVAAGPAWNYVSWGVQGSITFAPWALALTPTIGIDAGRYFDADLSFLAKEGSGVPVELKPLLEKVGYTYAGAMVGLEIGSQRGVSFVLRGGLSYFWLTAKGSAHATASGGTAGANDAQVTLTNPRLRATVPSLQLGFQYYF